jgi:hypothetical protein
VWSYRTAEPFERSASKLEHFLQSRPPSSHLQHRNILPTAPSAVQRSVTLSGLLSRRPAQSVLKAKRIVRDGEEEAGDEVEVVDGGGGEEKVEDGRRMSGK